MFSSENVNNIKNKQNKNAKKKHSLFIEKKAEEEEEDDIKIFLDNFQGDMNEYICNQKGSRVMQKFLNKITPENLNMLIFRIGKNISRLMIDLYGNYFCQKLIQSCSAEQRICVLNFV
jgi:hypothetical protein